MLYIHTMTKKELKILEKAFDADIESRFHKVSDLYHGKCKTTKKLADEGYLIYEERILGAGKPFPVRINGYRLTLKGHYTYCISCDKL